MGHLLKARYLYCVWRMVRQKKESKTMGDAILKSMKDLTSSFGSTLTIEVVANRVTVGKQTSDGPCTVASIKKWLNDIHREKGRRHAATDELRGLNRITFRQFSDQDGYHFFAVFSDGNMTDYRLYMHGNMNMKLGLR